MIQPGDTCIVLNHADDTFRSKIYRSLIGKKVLVIGEKDSLLGKHSVQVIDPEPSTPWERSTQLRLKAKLLRKVAD